MTIGEVLQEIINEKDINSVRELARICGISNTYLSGFINGDNNSSPSLETIKQICESIEYPVWQFLNKIGYIPDYEIEPGSLGRFENVKPFSVKKFRLLGDIACGEPILANEEVGFYIETSTEINSDFVLKAQGDSMINARINDGDYVFIKEQATVDNGQIAAVVIDSTATLKRVYFYPEQQKLVLQAENPAFEPLVYVGKELKNVRILGKAVAFQSNLK